MPPNVNVAALGKVAATQDCQTEIEAQILADEAASANSSGDAAKVSLYVDAEHRRAPRSLLGRFVDALVSSKSDKFRPRLARVRFGENCFYFDPEGRWAVVAPIFEHRQIVNWAAFAIDDDTLRRTFRPGYFAVGLYDAAWDAHFHPQHRLLVHYSVRSWLQCGCIGVLPVNWQAMAIHILQERYGLLYASEADGDVAHGALHSALTLPEGFVLSRSAA